MTATVTIEILLGVLTVIVGVGSFFAATHANRLQARSAQMAVDAAAYSRAKEIYEGALLELRLEVESMRAEIIRLRAEIVLLRARLKNNKPGSGV